jgi:cholesterol transport system auxiliary component
MKMGPCWSRRFVAFAALGLMATGCVSLDIGKDTAPQAQFRIVDGGSGAAATASRSNGRNLIVSPQPSASIDDSYALAYSRLPNQRAAYQFATWSDRPSNRLAQLLVERLAARRAFESVSLAGRGVAGDLLLNVSVNDFYHDAAASPGTARVEVAAELIDRNTRKLLARQRFAATAPVAEANSAAAAAALSAASTKVLDDLVVWVEARATPAALASTH